MVVVAPRLLCSLSVLAHCCLRVRRHVDEQRAQRQEAHAVLAGEEVAVDDTFGLIFLAVTNEFTHPLQRVFGAWRVVVVRRSRPERRLIEVDTLVCGTTIDHRSDEAVAQRQRFPPVVGGLLIFQAQPVVGRSVLSPTL